MITIYYQDAFNIERKQEFENLDSALLAFSGCLTLPDYYVVNRITRNGEELDFTGKIGDLYYYFQRLD